MTNKPELSDEAKLIKKNVLAAMQDAEEMGGVRDTADYLQLMQELHTEISDRMVCAALHA